MGYGRITRLRAFAARVAGVFGLRKPNGEFDEEVQAHLQLLLDRFVAEGMSREDAAAAARRQFGNTTLLQEDRRELGTLVSVEDSGATCATRCGVSDEVRHLPQWRSPRWDWGSAPRRRFSA